MAQRPRRSSTSSHRWATLVEADTLQVTPKNMNLTKHIAHNKDLNKKVYCLETLWNELTSHGWQLFWFLALALVDIGLLFFGNDDRERRRRQGVHKKDRGTIFRPRMRLWDCSFLFFCSVILAGQRKRSRPKEWHWTRWADVKAFSNQLFRRNPQCIINFGINLLSIQYRSVMHEYLLV